jgi:levanase/fructan beta-fructosidase
MKWVLMQGNGNYSVGTFEGTKFEEETERHPCDVGPNFYATQSWHNTDTGDGRRIQAAWMRGSDFPDMPFNQQISFPCELTLHKTANGLRISREPISEISRLYGDQDAWTNRVLHANETLRLEPSGRMFHIQAQVSIAESARLIFNIRGNSVILTPKSVESGTAPVSMSDDISYVEMLVDCASIETFINHGAVSSSRFVLPKDSGLSLKAEGGAVSLKSMTVHVLNSAWPSSVKN